MNILQLSVIKNGLSLWLHTDEYLEIKENTVFSRMHYDLCDVKKKKTGLLTEHFTFVLVFCFNLMLGLFWELPDYGGSKGHAIISLFFSSHPSGGQCFHLFHIQFLVFYLPKKVTDKKLKSCFSNLDVYLR